MQAVPVIERGAYVPRVQWFGDSIPYGVGTTSVGGPREAPYLSAQSAGQTINFCGSQTTSATGAIPQDPYCECYPGITAVTLNGNGLLRLANYLPDIAIYSAGTNDIGNAGATAADVAAAWSTALDLMWGMRPSANFQIVITTILKRLDGFDTTVQAANALLVGVAAGKSYASHVTVASGVYACIPNPQVGVNMNDIVHPNDVGDTYYGNYMYTVLAPLIAAVRAGL